ncbi:hypothetical protein ILUMI_07987 [Ignelater luminosus]|uniref:DUF4817 domain-containing protein n=1 Tax=Ignelater luminosus TaxID=2038154 RepID=A0A8K0GHG7_IGNLU|nr:hypothetical protein ILUMI_07987 [Ignelater luminosus]
MNQYTNREMADIHYVYGKADGNTREAQRLYRGMFPGRQRPAKDTCFAVFQRTVRISNLEMEVLDTIEEHSEGATEFQASNATVCRMLHE